MITVAAYVDHAIAPAGGGTANVTDVALKTALTDPGNGGVLSRPGVQIVATITPVTADSVKGYLNGPVNLTDVKIEAHRADVPIPYRFDDIVDTDRSRILDSVATIDIGPGASDMTVPAGSAWFYRIVRESQEGGGNAMLPLLVRGSYAPADADVVLALVDSEGFGMLKNASTAGNRKDVDISGHALWLNRSSLAGPGWNASIDIPSVNVSPAIVSIQPDGKAVSTLPVIRPADDYYFVMINEDSRDISATFSPDDTFF